MDSLRIPLSARKTDLGVTPWQICATGGVLFGMNLINPNAGMVYAKFYNALAASVVVGTTTPVKTIAIPASATGGSFSINSSIRALFGFSTALTVAITTGVADNDTGAPGAALYADISYNQ